MRDIPIEDINKVKRNYFVKNNTFIKDKVADVRRRVEVEIGDEKQEQFYPQIKTKHWDNECNFSIRLIDEDYENGIIRTTDDEKVEWERNGRIARMYEKETGDEDGGFEFEVEIASKPTDNELLFSIQTKGLRFYKQRGLTEEERLQGYEEVEEHVLGSYAVYHQSKKHNRTNGKHYRTGKAFHIYRPWAEDANGVRVWCEMNIDVERGVLSVVIPQKFLDSAQYPIIVDPTLGYTTLGSSGLLPTWANASSDTSIIRGQVYTLPVNATLDSIHIAAYRITGSDPQAIDFFAAVYSEDSNGSGSHDLVASVETLGLSITGTEQFFTFTAAGESLLAGDYIICGLGNGEDADGVIRGRRDTGADPDLTEYFESENGAGSYAARRDDDPWAETSSTTDSIFSLYITYTEAASTTEELIQKSLSYEVVSAQSPTQKSLQYRVVAPASEIQKSLEYQIISTPTATEKSLTYEVVTETAIQKSLSYEVTATVAAIEKSLAYEVITTPSATEKPLSYEVVTDTAIQKSLTYEVITTPSATEKSLVYEVVSTPTATEKSLKYTVISPVEIEKSLAYRVLTAPTATEKTLSYEVLTENNIQKSLVYEVTTDTAVQKSLKYEVLSQASVQKSLTYEVVSDVAVQKSLGYEIVTATGIEKELEYAMVVEGVVQKSLRYVVMGPKTIQKSLEYVVISKSRKGNAILTSSYEHENVIQSKGKDRHVLPTNQRDKTII